MAESEDVLMKVKEASEKAGLKLNTLKTKMMTSHDAGQSGSQSVQSLSRV